MRKSYVFDLDLAEVQVTLNKMGVPTIYLLREMSGELRNKFIKEIRAKAKATGKGDEAEIEINNLDGVEDYLVHLCLFDEQGKQVTLEEVGQFPSKVVSQLFEIANELSAIPAKAQELVGND